MYVCSLAGCKGNPGSHSKGSDGGNDDGNNEGITHSNLGGKNGGKDEANNDNNNGGKNGGGYQSVSMAALRATLSANTGLNKTKRFPLPGGFWAGTVGVAPLG